MPFIRHAAGHRACDRTPLPLGSKPARILFVGNSFLHGHAPPVLRYKADRVTDLNGSGLGGVPAVFKQLAEDAGFQFDVSTELASGQTLQFHYNERRALFAGKPWDIVVMQDYSTLSRERRGDATAFIAAAGKLEALVIFGRLTGRDPASVGAASSAGRELGLSAEQIQAAQGVASRELRVSPAAPASPTRP